MEDIEAASYTIAHNYAMLPPPKKEEFLSVLSLMKIGSKKT